MLGNCSCFCLLLTFSKLTFRNTLFRTLSECETVLGSDQVRQNVGSDLGQNCLQRASADIKIHNWQRVKNEILPAIGDFCHLLIFFANSLDPDQACYKCMA